LSDKNQEQIVVSGGIVVYTVTVIHSVMINITSLLGSEAETLLGNFIPKISKESLILP